MRFYPRFCAGVCAEVCAEVCAVYPNYKREVPKLQKGIPQVALFVDKLCYLSVSLRDAKNPTALVLPDFVEIKKDSPREDWTIPAGRRCVILAGGLEIKILARESIFRAFTFRSFYESLRDA